jgi:hypothetical protein
VRPRSSIGEVESSVFTSPTRKAKSPRTGTRCDTSGFAPNAPKHIPLNIMEVVLRWSRDSSSFSRVSMRRVSRAREIKEGPNEACIRPWVLAVNIHVHRENTLVPPHKGRPTRKVITRKQERKLEDLLRRAAKYLATRKQGRSRRVTKRKRRVPARRP